MPALKIAVQLASLRLPLKQALHKAAQLGAQAVEICARSDIQLRQFSQTGLRQLRKMLDDLNLTVAAVGFPTQHGYDIEEGLDRRIAATKEAMKFAYSIGANVVVNQVGTTDEEPEGPQWDLLVEVLGDLGAFGLHIGATMAAQTGSQNPQALARLIERLPQGALGVNFNPGHLLFSGFSPLDAARLLGLSTMHVHATDGIGRRTTQVQLGDGEADYPELLGILQQFDYHGFFTVVRDQSTNPQLEISQAIAYLQGL